MKFNCGFDVLIYWLVLLDLLVLSSLFCFDCLLDEHWFIECSEIKGWTGCSNETFECFCFVLEAVAWRLVTIYGATASSIARWSKIVAAVCHMGTTAPKIAALDLSTTNHFGIIYETVSQLNALIQRRLFSSGTLPTTGNYNLGTMAQWTRQVVPSPK